MPFPQSEIAKQRFEQIEPIGKGAFGEVYRGIDQRLRRPVAIKEISSTLSPDDRQVARQRFEHEAQIVAQINSPHVVTVYGFDVDQQQGEQYLYLEYMPHGTLAELLQRQGKLAEREAAVIARDVARAIQTHWARDIVHRDIKPSNILITRDEQGGLTGAKLSDYGIAQDLGGSYRSRGTGQGHPGTSTYMSPEQATSQAVLTAASDLYNVGLILWEMLTGTPRYKAQTSPVSATTLTASPRMAQIVARLLEPHIGDRYQEPIELVRDLDVIIASPRPLAAVKMTKAVSARQPAGRWLLALVPVLLLLMGGVAYASGMFDGGVDGGANAAAGVSDSVVVAVVESPTSIESPSATRAAPTLVPTVAPTSTPESTDTPEPTPTDTPEPTPTDTPEPTPTDTPEPTATSQPTAANTPEPTPTIESAPVLFQDTFDVILRPEWTILQPGLAIGEGGLEGESGLVLYDPQADNYVIKTVVQGTRYRVYFRSSERQDRIQQGYYFGCSSSECGWGVVIDGQELSLSTGRTSDVLFDGKPHVLTIEVNGRNFSAAVDDEPFTSVTDERITSGKVGLESRRYRNVGRIPHFDSFTLTPLE